MTPLIFSLSGLDQFYMFPLNYNILSVIFFVTTSFLLISKFPTYSFKKIVIRRKETIFLLFGIILFFGLLLIYTFEVITISSMIYLTLLPISFIHYYRIKKQQNEVEKDDNEDFEDVL